MTNKISKVLVVCLGNICRSPTGEAVLKAKSSQKGLDLIVDSAGTEAYHSGEKPDQRSMQAGERRGYSFKGMTSRKIRLDDFEHFDLILAADRSNLSDLQQQCPLEYQHKLKLFLSFGDNQYDEIPDPYYGGENGFEVVIDLIEDASDKLIQRLLE